MMLEIKWGKWTIFDRGHCDKLLYRSGQDQDSGGGLATQDVLVKHTPWVGGPPTEADTIALETIAEKYAVGHSRVVVDYLEVKA